MSNDTAILIFGRHAAIEAQHKLSARPLTKGAQRLCRVLLQQTRRTAKAAGLPVVWVSSSEQQGSSFGERLCHALDQVWSQGYSRVLLVGTDTPDLSARLLRQAADTLQQGQAVLGAAKDGGIYLMGLQRGQYCPKALAALPWEQATLFRALHHYLVQTQQPTAVLAPVLGDVDNWDDVHQWVDQLGPSRLRLFLKQCTQCPAPSCAMTSARPVHSTTLCLLPCNRPPPTVAA